MSSSSEWTARYGEAIDARESALDVIAKAMADLATVQRCTGREARCSSGLRLTGPTPGRHRG